MVRLTVRRGRPIAQLVCVRPHIQMLCPRGIGPWFESELWPFAAKELNTDTQNIKIEIETMS